MLYFFAYVYNIPCKRKGVKLPELPLKPSKNGQKNNRPLPVSLVRNVQSICHSLICDVTVVAQHLDGKPPFAGRFGPCRVPCKQVYYTTFLFFSQINEGGAEKYF